MSPEPLRTPAAVERELRTRLSVVEYRVLQSRLTGAVKAIAMLRERAADLVPLMFGDGLERAKALPIHTQSTLAMLIEELLITAAGETEGPTPITKQILKLVKTARRSQLEARGHR